MFGKKKEIKAQFHRKFLSQLQKHGKVLCNPNLNQPVLHYFKLCYSCEYTVSREMLGAKNVNTFFGRKLQMAKAVQ